MADILNSKSYMVELFLGDKKWVSLNTYAQFQSCIQLCTNSESKLLQKKKQKQIFLIIT